MESFNNSNNENSNNENKRTIAPGMPPLPPTSQRMRGQSSSNPNIDPHKLKRTLASRQYAQTYRNRQTCMIMQLEQTMRSLEANVQTASAMICHLARQRYSFQVENGKLKRKLSFFSREIESKEAERVQLMKEKDKLKRLYVEQRQNYEERLKSNMANARFGDMGQPGRPTHT